MKNFEAYKDYISKYGTNPMAIKNGKAIKCTEIQCDKCIFKPVIECTEKKGQWLYEEYQKPKIKIPLATKAVLENLDERWEWIAKDKDGLFIFSTKPTKGKSIWKITGFGNVKFKEISNIFKCNLFDFLSWEDEEPTNIKELLENCEVIE